MSNDEVKISVLEQELKDAEIQLKNSEIALLKAKELYRSAIEKLKKAQQEQVRNEVSRGF